MIPFDTFQLDNGLRILVHQDPQTPMATVNVLYDVGSRDEDPHKTGFAHLFEHLMFGGSKHIPAPDIALQRVGAESNAFTSPDLTNYYATLPATNIETAFWVESDRMLSLSFDPKVLEVQRKVVIEEFKQRYLNQPYGDLWLHLRPLAYAQHPYRWATIGKEIAHIENATLDDVQAFFFRFYRPNNAILSVASPLPPARVLEMAKRWFGDIPAGPTHIRNLPQELPQTEPRHKHLLAEVPLDQLVIAFPMPSITHPDYEAYDLLSDLLGGDESSFLYRRLVSEQAIFQSLSAYVTGSRDPGLLVISGRVQGQGSLEAAQAALWQSIEDFLSSDWEQVHLTRAKNQAETVLAFSEVSLFNRAYQLAFGELLGKPNRLNERQAAIQSVDAQQMQRIKASTLTRQRSNTLFYGRSK
ncbi:MAG: M16 family metallopeptidase [Bernardetiaceae bacterium]